MRGLNKKKRVLTGKHFMLGNYAVVEGALAAGCDFFAGYPITPANVYRFLGPCGDQRKRNYQ